MTVLDIDGIPIVPREYVWEGKTYLRTSEPRPYDSVLFCPLCRVEIHVTRAHDRRPTRAVSLEAERACEEHLHRAHPVRCWLHRKLGLRGAITPLLP